MTASLTPNLPAVALALALGAAFTVLPAAAADADRQGEVLRRRPERQERLQGRRRHHLRRHVQGRLPGQRLVAGPQGHLREDRVQDLARPATASWPSSRRRRADVHASKLPASSRARAQARALPGRARHAAGRRLLRGARRELHGRRRADAPLADAHPRGATRCRCTASACRSAPSGRSTRRTSTGWRALIDRYEPAVFSEHLAWSSHGGVFLNDLLPLPYDARDAAARVRAHRPGAGRGCAAACCSRTRRPTSSSRPRR